MGIDVCIAVVQLCTVFNVSSGLHVVRQQALAVCPCLGGQHAHYLCIPDQVEHQVVHM